MAINKEKTRDLLDSIDELFDLLVGDMSEKNKYFLKKHIMGPAMEEIRTLVDESRPPVMMLMGRSGHGKSSLINALSGKKVAIVNDIKPQEPETVPYTITFPETFSTWSVIDTRGIFESTKPDGAEEDDAIELLKNGVIKHTPDVILHLISSPEIRTFQNDLVVYNEIMDEVEKRQKVKIPTILVLTKPDTLGNPREWPPEEYPKKAGILTDKLDYTLNEVLKIESSSFNNNVPYYGYLTKGDHYVGVIPVSALEDDLWNINSLSNLIGKNLEESAKLDFFQAQRNTEQLKKISSSLIKRFSAIAGGVGANPIPAADIFILTPLQFLMIATIAGLSGREVSKETVYEYLSALGINLGAAVGLREGARQIAKFIPIGGSVISGSIAGGATYAIGKSAEAYFFSGEKKEPEKFINENEG